MAVNPVNRPCVSQHVVYIADFAYLGNMEEIYEKVPCRKTQLQDLLNLLGKDDESLPLSVFISGNTSTGKSLCVNTVLQYLRFKHVIILCLECYTPTIMYEYILTGLYESQVDIKCDSLRELMNNLNAYSAEQTRYEPIVLVFDRAEKLLNMDQSIMSTFLRLREFCSLNICTFFITHLTYENFYFKMGVRAVREPVKMYFPNYTKEELFEIIFLHQKAFVRHLTSKHIVDCGIKEDLERPELFGNFLNAFLSEFYRPCRDLMEYQYQAQVIFAKYCEPIIRNEIKSTDLPKLWHHITPILQETLEVLNLKMDIPNLAISSPRKEELFEFPIYTKFVLIAAYLASYNPPKEDKRLFMKNHGKQGKSMQPVKKKAKIEIEAEKLNTQLGPRVFTLNRLMAIFYSIVELKTDVPCSILSQIATLVDLKLIAGRKKIDLDNPKFKCTLGYNFISAVAQTVGFNINEYLYDFI
ncbi:origin recognition complex subunit 5-like [Maniola jurtina]|uniref:origin recognition complex subunit 5-like n=1 Tax=Maniola jurtina TaxID=191418 RepID=UPI001E687E66|nr:origin recognition complex subunit 5-like [Maniola jurtina]